MEKKCLFCGNIFYKTEYTSTKRWGEMRFCSHRCYSESKKNKPMAHNPKTGMKFNCAVCGKETYRMAHQFSRTRFITCESECAGKIKGIYYRGENGANWKGGPKDYRRERKTAVYKKFMLNHLIESGGRCENCGYTHKIKVHHIIPVHIEPEYMYVKENLVCLSDRCHKPLHGKDKERMNDLFTINFEQEIWDLNLKLTNLE